MLLSGNNSAAVTSTSYTKPKAAPPPGPDSPTTAQPYEGAYQADQAAAEQAYAQAQAQLQAQRQLLYNDYGLDSGGNYNGDEYSQYGQVEHDYGDQKYQLDTQNQQFQRDTGIAQSQNQHDLDTLLSQLGTQQGRTQTDADTQQGRLSRDYGLGSADLDRQTANLEKDYGFQRTDALQSYGDQMDVARANGLGRGFSGGLGQHPSQKLAAALSTNLGRLGVGHDDQLAQIGSARNRLSNSYGDSTSDVRTQLARAMEDFGTQRSQGQYDFTQRASELANAMADQSSAYQHGTGELDYSHNLNKSNLASAFAQALAANSADQLSASRQLTTAKIDARTKYANQAVSNNQNNLQSLLAMFGL